MNEKARAELIEWWDEVGSGLRPKMSEDLEEFAKRIAEASYELGFGVGSEMMMVAMRLKDDA